MTPSISPELHDIATLDDSIRSGTGNYIPEAPKEETPAEIPQAEPPKAEAPKEEPVAKDEPKPEVVAQPQHDIAKILSEASNGKITSADDLAKILEENSTLSEKLKSAPELGDYTLKMDAWVKKGYEPELFHLVHDLPIDEMSADETVKSYLKIQNPDWTEEDIDLYVKHTYNQMSEEDEGYNASNVRVGGLKLKQDAARYGEELRKLHEATEYAYSDDAEAADMESKRQSAWRSNLPSLSVSKIPFQLDDKNTFDFVPSQAQIQSALKAVEKAVLNAPVAFDDNGKSLVQKIIKNELITQNINNIIKAVSTQVSSLHRDKAIKEVSNPSGADPQPAPVIEKSIEDKNHEKMEAFFLGR
jgi:hypothetical protein